MRDLILRARVEREVSTAVSMCLKRLAENLDCFEADCIQCIVSRIASEEFCKRIEKIGLRTQLTGDPTVVLVHLPD